MPAAHAKKQVDNPVITVHFEQMAGISSKKRA